jgi:integrase/recombinase XerD
VACIRIRGKGRKERSVPLWKTTAVTLKHWLEEIEANEQAPLFPNRHGHSLTRSGVEDRLRRAVSTAAARCPSLRDKHVSPHTLRHTTAMHLLQAGVDVTVIALWLGHESSDTTHQYVEADLEMKQRVLDRIDAPSTSHRRRKKAGDLLDFLDRL